MQKGKLFFIGALFVLAVSAEAAVVADLGTEIGKMRPELHSAGFGPQISSCPPTTIAEIKSMGLKGSRTHDWALLNPGQLVCDYLHIFPLMHLDAKDPKNYVFAPTDYVLKRTREELGHDIFFRLGPSIEHSGPSVHFTTRIPDDFEKVAETFAGTVRHYNEGWANGFKWGIKYWEIWNEPDNINNMWCLPGGDAGKGKDREAKIQDQMAREIKRLDLFSKFYVTCLKRLKSEFGDSIKVGGPALCTWRAPRRDRIGTADYFKRLLADCKAAGVAPDFISWHYYGNNPKQVLNAIAEARKLCDDAGFPNCELILNEWHYRHAPWAAFGSRNPKVRRALWEGPASHNGIDSSCFNLTLLSRFQTSALDQSYYYGCKNTGAWGYKNDFDEKYKVYYGLKLFGEFIRDYPTICSSSSDSDGITIIAAKSADSTKQAVLVTDYRSYQEKLSVEIKGVAPDAECEIIVHDYTRDLASVKGKLVDGKLELPKCDKYSGAFLVKF